MGMTNAPLLSYFGMVFGISWVGGLAVYAGVRMNGPTWGPAEALGLFPVLILSVAGTGFGLTRLVDGKSGSLALWRRIVRWRVGPWYLLVLLPPALIFLVLEALRGLGGPSFAPNFFLAGFLFGIPAGLFEEIGWSGYAFPKLCSRLSWNQASVLLGVLWGLWHLPVVDALGAAAPHRVWWPAFFFAFVLILSAMRIIIFTSARPGASSCWVRRAFLPRRRLCGTECTECASGSSPAPFCWRSAGDRAMRWEPEMTADTARSCIPSKRSGRRAGNPRPVDSDGARRVAGL
jgi:membrane protease YdiL (CAAX protease family)